MLIISALFVNIVRLVGVLLLFGRCRACWWGAGMGWRGGGRPYPSRRCVSIEKFFILFFLILSFVFRLIVFFIARTILFR